MTREGMGSRLCTRTSEANCARATVHVYIDVCRGNEGAAANPGNSNKLYS